MTQSIINIDLTAADRTVSFQLSIDSDCLSDRELMNAIKLGGSVEPEVCHLMMRVMRPGDYAIDGGANIGFFTVLLSKLVGKDGCVLSVEPGQNNLYKLEENIRLNKLSNVEVVDQPLWDKYEMVKLYLCEDGGKNSLAAHEGTRGSSDITTVVLDDYLDLRRRLRLLKLDIEGAEEKALRGALSFLNETHHCPYIVAELNIEALPKFNSSPASICDFMRERGYNLFLLHPNGALPTYVPRRTKVQPTRLNWNVLFSTFEAVGAAWPEIVI